MTKPAKWILTSIVGLSLTALVLGATHAADAADEPAAGAAQPQQRPLAGFIRNAVRQLVTLRSQLAVTDEQRTAIREIVVSHRAEIVPVVKDISAKRQVLRAAVLADKPDEQAIRAAADAMAKSIGDAAVLASQVAAQVKPLLTEEQKQRIHQFQEERRGALETFLDEALPQ